MLINGVEIPFWLYISKVVKIMRMKASFFVGTAKTKLVLKLLDCPYGRNLNVCGKLFLRPTAKGSIKLGNNVTIVSRFLSNSVGITNPTFLECIEGGRIEIGNNTGFTSTIMSSRRLIKIGNFVKIGGNVRIFDHDYHSTDYLYRRNYLTDSEYVKSQEVIIEDDVFIGANSIILKGVHIGARSIVAAGSVVTIKNIPSDSVVAGNPAKIIKTNSNCLIEK
jgi:acetyltransferase-like isoleucine patch superfamily enzyme